MKLKLTQEQTFGIIRHALTAVGAILVYRGKSDEASWTMVTGAVMGIVAVLWSALSKRA